MSIDPITLELISTSTATLKWLVEYMGESEWHERRSNVVAYFKGLSDKLYRSIDAGNPERKFDPIAFYDDWLAWYMYLIESQTQRPTSGDATQLSRILPTFAAIGRSISSLKLVGGIENRMKKIVYRKNKDTDSSLFELLVAACYVRNGWTVNFIEEDSRSRTPDFEATKGHLHYWVECKRLAKVNSYAEVERQEWQKRVTHLFNAMLHHKIPAFAQIDFKVPLEDTPETILGQTYFAYLKNNLLEREEKLSLPMLDLTVRKVDIDQVNDYLGKNDTKPNTSAYINLIAGSYDLHGNYTLISEWKEMFTLGHEDELEVFNEHVLSLRAAYAARWESHSEHATTLKAKDVKKLLVKAVDQIPDGKKGIVHIGFETVSGPHIELSRHQKIRQTIQNFDLEDKQVDAIYCHAMQPLMTLEGYDCAETTIHLGENALKILPDNFLLAIDSVKASDDTHWRQDLATKH